MWQSGRIPSLQFLLLFPIKQLTDQFITHWCDKQRGTLADISAPLGALGLDVWLPDWSSSVINRKHKPQQNLEVLKVDKLVKPDEFIHLVLSPNYAIFNRSFFFWDRCKCVLVVWPDNLRHKFHNHTSASGVYLSCGNSDTFPSPK